MSDFIGLSSTRIGGETKQFSCNTAGLKEGAIVVHDTTAGKNNFVKAPGAAAATGIAGVIVNAQASGGTAVGDSVDVQYTGVANVLLDGTQAVTVGDKVIVSDTDGSCKGLGTTDSCDILGVTLITRTAGAANELIPVRLQIQFTGDTVP